MNKNSYLLFVLILSISLSSCMKDMELEQSVFIADPEYPGLPQYSEWGYNTFGAYYDREIFVSNDIEIPLKVIVTTDTTTFSFKGQKGSGYYGNSTMAVKFIVPGFYPRNYADLLVLNDSIVDINTSGGDIKIYIDGNLVEATILNGNIDFNRVQRLIVDAEQVQLIASGYFFFQVIINDEPISISNGRFDIGIGASNFFDLSEL